MTIKKIVEKYLRDVGADGLCSNDGCGCGLDDLMPCGFPGMTCQPAVRRKCEDPESDWYGEMIYMPMEQTEPQDIRTIVGTWPDKLDDGFEEAIDELRHGKEEV